MFYFRLDILKHMLLEKQAQKIFDERLRISIVHLRLNDWSSNSEDRWGYLDIQKGQGPINFYSDVLAKEGDTESMRTRRFKAIHDENIAWLTENGYETNEGSKIAKALGWMFGRRDHMEFRKEEVSDSANDTGNNLEILLYTNRHTSPQAWGAMYLPVKEGTIEIPEDIKDPNERDYFIQEHLRSQSRELCQHLGEDFNIFTSLKMVDQGVKYESWVRFGLPITQLTAKEADQRLHKIAQSSMEEFSRYMTSS